MTEAEMYRKAADLLRRDGWCKGEYINSAGKRCMYGAMIDAGVNRVGHPVLQALIDEWRVSRFNDHDCETIDDAIAALEIAADLAEPSP